MGQSDFHDGRQRWLAAVRGLDGHSAQGAGAIRERLRIMRWLGSQGVGQAVLTGLALGSHWLMGENEAEFEHLCAQFIEENRAAAVAVDP